MLICNKLSEAKKILAGRATAVALGTFDGIHVGHRSIIRRAVSLAEAHKICSVVYTFSNHPMEIIASEKAPMQIGDNISKCDILSAMGVQMLVNVAFSEKLCRQSAEDFLAELCRCLNPAYLVTGPNFTFGSRAKGNPRMLLRMGDVYGYQAEIGRAVQIDAKMVSSTRIRGLIEAGELHRVNEYLGRYFSFGGRVIHGDHRGRKLGFPTANLAIGNRRAMLPNGAYAVQILLDGKRYNGIANIGDNPTFEGRSRRLEVNILDFSKDIYDHPMTVLFVEKMREQKKFGTVEALVRQLRADEKKARQILKNALH